MLVVFVRLNYIANVFPIVPWILYSTRLFVLSGLYTPFGLGFFCKLSHFSEFLYILRTPGSPLV